MVVDALAEHPNQIDKSPYAYAWNNPISLNDPDGNCPNCVIGFIVGAGLDIAFQTIVEGKSLDEVNYKEAAIAGAIGVAGGGIVSQSRKLYKGFKATKKARQLAKNRKKGAAFEKKVVKGLQDSQDDIVEQITIKTKSGTRTRIDVVGKNKKTGKIELTEAKSSKSAPLTKNQKKAFPEIAESGGEVVGKGKGIFKKGTEIPATKVNIKRPQKKPWWKLKQ